jgi:hypothetical protein
VARGGEFDVAGRRHRGSVQLAGVTSDDDVLDAAAVERLDDLERVEALATQPCTLVTELPWTVRSRTIDAQPVTGPKVRVMRLCAYVTWVGSPRLPG